jgi:hypothetical protein
MTINTAVAKFLARALELGALPPGGAIFEIGESTIAGYNTAHELLEILSPFVPPERLQEAKRQIEEAAGSKSHYWHGAGPARAVYHAVFEPSLYISAELGLAPRRLCVDLNFPVDLGGRQFDYVINNGTSQHVFDQANFFKTVHQATRAGGVMLHWTSYTGEQWLNFGYYAARPDLFFELAEANNYEVLLIGVLSDAGFWPISRGDDVVHVLRAHPELERAMLAAVLKKTVEAPFEIKVHGDFRGGMAAQYRLSRTPRVIPRDERVNLALLKPALQSSTSRASLHDDPAIDAAGGNNGIVTGYYGFCTSIEPDPWWMVDLGSPQPIQEVVVFNRIDTLKGSENYCAKLELLLSDDGENWSKVFDRTDERPFGGADGNPLRILVFGRTARFVRLRAPGNAYLSLDEVQVY